MRMKGKDDRACRTARTAQQKNPLYTEKIGQGARQEAAKRQYTHNRKDEQTDHTPPLALLHNHLYFCIAGGEMKDHSQTG